MRKTLCWIRSRPKTSALIVLLAVVVLINVLAYRHAHAMTHFVSARPPVGDNMKWTYSPSLGDRAALLFNGVTIYRPRNEHDPSSVGLAFTPHEVPGDLGKLEAWYVPHEESRGVVLMFHGYMACKGASLAEAKAFHEMGYACFLVDFPGSGGSEGSVTTLGYREADDVAKCVSYVQDHWPGQSVVLFGQSMGSVAVLRALAVHELHPAAVVLECPFDRMTSAVEARCTRRGLPAFPTAQLLVFWGGVQNGFNGFGHNPVDYASQVTSPVLLLHGSNDQGISAIQMQSIYDHLKGEKELHYFEGLGHEAYVPRSATEWKAAVGSFLKDKT
jgi:alpha-beta hydrolase superfamily lysophospholipase